MLDAIIVGGDGQIGQALLKHLRLKNFEVVSTTRRWPPTEGQIPFDLEYQCELPKAGTYFFSTGINGFKPCEDDENRAMLINVSYLLILAKRLYDRGARLVYLSSSAAETHPSTVYGTTKRLAEFKFMELGAAVYRFGPVAFPGRYVYPNEVYCPMNLDTLVEALSESLITFKPGLHRLTNRDWERDPAVTPDKWLTT
jgi:dTDP-4-dehydrorhamnose reductase